MDPHHSPRPAGAAFDPTTGYAGVLCFSRSHFAGKALDHAISIAKRCGVPLKIAAKVDAVDRDYFKAEIRKLITPPDVEYIGEISDGEKSSFQCAFSNSPRLGVLNSLHCYSDASTIGRDLGQVSERGAADAWGIWPIPTPQDPGGAGDIDLSTISLEHPGGSSGHWAGAGPLRPAGSICAPATTHAAAPPGSARALDWFTFFLADIQTGFGPFVAIYLTAHHWAQFDIGLVLTAGGLMALAAQMPAGALVDAVRSARLIAALAVAAVGLSALAIALWPTFSVVIAARMIHAAASCVLGPVIAALSLALVGHAALGTRLGRNARFASIGNGVAAAAMGACGFLISNQAVFLLTAVLAVPAILALRQIHSTDVEPPSYGTTGAATAGLRDVLSDRRLLVFAGCILLFQLANAAMLPLMGAILTVRSPVWATTLIGACIVVPQLIVALFAPWVGRVADRWGRRPP